MLRYLLYKIKSLVQRNTGLYRVIYILITFNFDYFKQSLNAPKYPSKFGGMWTDRTDYDQICYKKLRNGTLSNQRKTQLDEWRKEGRILIPGYNSDQPGYNEFCCFWLPSILHALYPVN